MRLRWPFLFLAASCASAGGVTERSFSRDELADLAIATIDVVVVAKGPPLAAAELLDVQPFDAPGRTSVLAASPEDATQRDALADALAKDLSARGFAVHFVGEPQSVAPVAPAPPIQTSTVVMSSTAAAPAVTPALDAPGSAPHVASQLAADAKLEDVRLASTADAILVVRTVIVDQFYLHLPPTSAPASPGDTTPVRQIPGKSYPVVGRLLVGQAFLFDRKTGVRLWSRQLPDYPDGGKLLQNHPFLRFGFVQNDKRALPDQTKAQLAAAPFTAEMLREFPSAHAGKAEARAALDAIDVEAEVREEQFFDDAKVMLELELGYGAESSGTDLVLDGEPLPSLGTGAISPSGIVRGGARFGYLSPGRLVFSVAGQIGRAPASFSRSYHRDESFNEGGRDRNASVTIDGATTFGIEPGIGYLILLGEKLMLLPGGAVFLDVWSLDAAPSNVVTEQTHLRLGVSLDLDLLMSITPAFFARVGVGARGGFDVSGPAFVGASLSLGLGLFL